MVLKINSGLFRNTPNDMFPDSPEDNSNPFQQGQRKLHGYPTANTNQVTGFFFSTVQEEVAVDWVAGWADMEKVEAEDNDAATSVTEVFHDTPVLQYVRIRDRDGNLTHEKNVEIATSSNFNDHRFGGSTDTWDMEDAGNLDRLYFNSPDFVVCVQYRNQANDYGTKELRASYFQFDFPQSAVITGMEVWVNHKYERTSGPTQTITHLDMIKVKLYYTEYEIR